MTFRSHQPLRWAPALVVLLVTLLLLPALAQTAAAAPPAPTMDLQQLGAALESGPLDGYLVTTLRGTTPEQIPLSVQSLVDYSWGELILFEARGPQIDKIGGIAAGMSGSPVYVSDGGVHKLVGAVSYGDMFTLGGLGLATPIQYMAAIERDYPVEPLTSLTAPRPPKPGTYSLTTPVRTDEGVVRSVIMASSAQTAANVGAASGQSVMVPLGILEIGGAKPGSKAFARIAAKFAKSGLLVKAASGNGEWAGAPTPALEGGSPCAVLFSQGAVWMGAAGTVTYVDGDKAMLFGHPFAQFGTIDAALTGGDVQGVWSSSMEPYKLIAPRDVKGTCVQDRTWGVEAHLGQAPNFFPVSTTVNLLERRVSIHDASSVSEWLATANVFPTLPGDLVGEVVNQAIDQDPYPASATTTTTVVVSDSTGTYTIRHDNLWTSSYSVSYQTGRDAGSIVSQLVENPDGVLQPRIESVDVETTVSATQRSARIADVSLPDGIKVGDTGVHIEYYRYGSNVVQSVDATLTIPKGTSLNGRLTVTPATWDQWGGGWCSCCSDSPGGAGEADGAPQTLAELVDELNQTPQNGDLVIQYLPGSGGEEESPAEPASDIQTVVRTSFVFDSYYSGSTAAIALQAYPTKVPYGGSAQVMGTVQSSKDVEVQLFRRSAGSLTDVPVGQVTAVSKKGVATFVGVIPGLIRNATIIASTGPIDGSLPGSASAVVKVRAKVWLTGSAKLVVHVRPTDATRSARLQRKQSGRWVDYKKVAIENGTGRVNLPKGTHVLRAVCPGGAVCAAGSSHAYTVRVK